MEEHNQKYIRNFSIIAHIDHGKSTLADRIIQECNGLTKRELSNQMLDSMELERERGITIKAHTVRLNYMNQSNNYQLNLIDTPGHVDFSYEVNRSLAACDGSLLIIDSSQGIEAQTLANFYQAVENKHEIIPVLNKIDLPASDVENTKKQIQDILGIDPINAISVSAKTGFGIEKVLAELIKKIPPPKGSSKQTLKALLIDSWYDNYLGIIILVKIIDGKIIKGQKVSMIMSEKSFIVEKVGIFTPKKKITNTLHTGEIGFICANMKAMFKCKVGDTITTDYRDNVQALPGFKPSTPVVYSGLFPIETKDFKNLKSSLAKLQLNDASFKYELETSSALGHGFRCGFLGLLHLEIIQERLKREFQLNLINTSPSVIYKVFTSDNKVSFIYNPVEMPPIMKIKYIEEPWVHTTIMVPHNYLGPVLQLCTDRRGKQIELQYIKERIIIKYELPLNEVIINFYDKLKSITSGYASFDYYINSYERGDLVKVDILINSEVIGALSFIAHKYKAEYKGRELCKSLKNLIPKQLYVVPIQAAIGKKIISRENISAMRKDVTAKCYGGDVTRKNKLLDKQKKGKKRMKKFGKIEIPQSVFLEILKGN
jgi:GTP-binding protein LepA